MHTNRVRDVNELTVKEKQKIKKMQFERKLHKLRLATLPVLLCLFLFLKHQV